MPSSLNPLAYPPENCHSGHSEGPAINQQKADPLSTLGMTNGRLGRVFHTPVLLNSDDTDHSDLLLGRRM